MPDRDNHEPLPIPGETCCWACYATPVESNGYCAECNKRRETTLVCNACGETPARAALIPLDAKPGDQCPCCFIPDMDCDGTLTRGEAD